MKTRTVSSNVARLLTGTGLVMGALLAAAPLHAQEAPATDAADEDAVILVTGSRIQRDGYDQPTPVTVATTEDLLLSVPTSIADGLNRLPQFSGSRSRTFCCEVSSVGNYLNLRGLGTTRTLVLLDSRRVVPTPREVAPRPSLARAPSPTPVLWGRRALEPRRCLLPRPQPRRCRRGRRAR